MRFEELNAAWIEAFPFVEVGELPIGEKTPAKAKPAQGARELRQVFGDGGFGGP